MKTVGFSRGELALLIGDSFAWKKQRRPDLDPVTQKIVLQMNYQGNFIVSEFDTPCVILDARFKLGNHDTIVTIYAAGYGMLETYAGFLKVMQ